MTFSELSSYFEKLEKTTSRNAMIEILAELFSKTPASEIDKVIYLMQGRVAPLYVPLEFGMADKMVLKAIAKAYGIEEKEARAEFKKIGDLGEVAEKLAKEKQIKGKETSVESVFEALKKIAETGGSGSVEVKIETLSNLFKNLEPSSSRFVARIPVGRLRLGFSDMTVLDAFSWMILKDKTNRPEIERAYNIHPDLGFIGKTIKEKGVAGLKHIKPEVFTPILMARAERLSSGAEIIGKIGESAIEPKIDGFRLQIHFDGKKVKLLTRNLEDVTFMYPDIVAGVEDQIKDRDVIFEGEAIAYNPNTQEFLPFQETVQRKRKYGIEEKAKEIPLKLIAFDLLYLNGESYINKPYTERREALKKIIKHENTLVLSKEKVVKTAGEIELEFQDAVARGLEGIMAKRLGGVYQAGARGWNWIKYKRSYAGKLEDTIDAVAMGYYYGRGKRTAFGIGAFLIGVYDKKQDRYVTIARIGTGLTDEEWRGLKERGDKLKTEKKPLLYDVDKANEPDVWIKPSIVVEIRADEISRSPVHTAGRKMKPSKNGEAFVIDVPGFALRFPRLERFRDDKKPEDTTNLREIEEMYEAQRKK